MFKQNLSDLYYFSGRHTELKERCRSDSIEILWVYGIVQERRANLFAPEWIRWSMFSRLVEIMLTPRGLGLESPDATWLWKPKRPRKLGMDIYIRQEPPKTCRRRSKVRIRDIEYYSVSRRTRTTNFGRQIELPIYGRRSLIETLGLRSFQQWHKTYLACSPQITHLVKYPHRKKRRYEPLSDTKTLPDCQQDDSYVWQTSCRYLLWDRKQLVFR